MLQSVAMVVALAESNRAPQRMCPFTSEDGEEELSPRQSKHRSQQPVYRQCSGPD